METGCPEFCFRTFSLIQENGFVPEKRHHKGRYQSWLIGVGPPDRSGNHPAFCQPEFAIQPTGVACHGRTRSALGSSDFDTSEAREGRSGAADQGPTRCRPLEADAAVARAWLFPPAVFERVRGPLLHGVSTVHPWTSNSGRCLSRYPSDACLRWGAGTQVSDK